MDSELYSKWSLVSRYALAAGIFCVALLLRFLLFPVESGLAFITFYPAIVICFYLCGMGPGALMTVLSAVAAYYFFIPPVLKFAHEPGGDIAVAAFLFSAYLISRVIKQLQSYAEQLRGALCALKASEQRYLSILEDQTEIICRFKADGTLVFVNDAYCRLFGKSRETLIGHKWYPYAWERDIPFINEKLNSLSPANPVVTIENRILTADGDIRWGQFVNRAFFDDNGCLIELQAVGRDITERKLAEQSVRNESKKNEMLLDSASDGIHILDQQGNIVQFSDSFARMLGYTHAEAAKLNVADWDVQIPRDQLLDEIKRIIQWPAMFETKHRRKDGSVIDVEINAKSIELEGKRYIYASSRDITERKVMEGRLAAKAEEIQDLYDHAPCGYHSLDLDGIFRRINDTELEWLGCKREDVIGKMKISDFFTPAGKELFWKTFPQFLRGERIEALAFDLVGKTGNIRHVSVSATAIRDADGKILMSRSVLYDITELKKIQNKLHRLTLEQQAMLDNELVGIVKLRNRCSTWTNKAMERIFGYAPGELDGKPSRILFPDESSYQALGGTAYPIINAHGVYRTQLEMVRKDGEKLWVDISGMLLSEEDNESLWIMADITPIKKHQEEVELLAYHDILTGLPNRLLVSDRLNQAVAQTERSGLMLAVCYLDLDGFKPINDKFGHAAGDKLLIEVAGRIQASVRANDTVGRLGGDEFVLLLTDLENIEEYRDVLQRVMEAINKPIALDKSCEAKVGASIGVTLFPSDGSSPDTLIRHADQAMYQAKKSGRNRVCLFTPDLPG